MLNQIQARLLSVSETPALDAQVVLAHILGCPRSWVLAHPEISLSAEQDAALKSALSRLQAGEPLPYILGHWEFYGLDFYIDHHVLIPRPETELLVEQALGWLHLHPPRRYALDVGTGCGCIALALAHHIPDLHCLASDISPGALQLAERNLRRYVLQSQVELIRADLFPPLDKPFDLVCANLPYIPTAELAKLKVGQWEPQLALDGGADGLRVIDRFLEQAPFYLVSGGLLLMEIEANQGQAAIDLARRAFPAAEIALLPDLAGKDRLVRIQS